SIVSSEIFSAFIKTSNFEVNEEHEGMSDLPSCSTISIFRYQCLSQPKRPSQVVCRLTSAIDSVSGICFGQARTQFCAFPQSCTPPSSIITSRRSLLFIEPVG